MSEFTLHLGDCLEVMRALPDNSVDAIVTDPPYHLTAGKKGGSGTASESRSETSPFATVSRMNSAGFMGMQWDGGDIAFRPELWAEALRVLKPGGHLLAFSGSRTYHRMACAIEDAGFEIRDQLLWLYGSGFPKSLDVSKAIDKAAGAEREVIGTAKGKGGENLNTLARAGGGDAVDAKGCGAYGQGAKQITVDIPVTAPATDAAREWDGWGTALKPAHEPICMARKPLTGTVAANVLAHGTGALNIDACRIGFNNAANEAESKGKNRHADFGSGPRSNAVFGEDHRDRGAAGNYDPVGRWPANVVHDGSDEVVGLFPHSASVGHSPAARGRGGIASSGHAGQDGLTERHHDKGSAARFFYCAKASAADRDEGLEDAPARVLAMSNQAKAELARGNMHEGSSGINTAKLRKNHHPTVKPTALMQWLVRLVTPPGGVVLDPFMGSGSTGKACMAEGFEFVGIERDPDYMAVAHSRIWHAQQQAEQANTPPEPSPQLGLFGDAA